MGSTPHQEVGTLCPDGTRRRRAYRVTWGAMLTALVLAAAACGGGATKTAAASTTTTTTNRAAQTQAFLQCMQSHGVKITSTRGLGGGGGGRGAPGDAGGTTLVPPTTFPPQTLPPGVTQQQYDAALQACRSLLPTGGRTPQNDAALQAYINCINLQLQQHGATTLPTTGRGLGGFGQGGNQSGSTTTSNPVLDAARAHCANLLPAGGFGGPRGSTTTSPTT